MSNEHCEDRDDNLCDCSQQEECHDSCNAKVINTHTQTEFLATPVVPNLIPAGAFVGKIPIVLAETSITIPVISNIKLEKRALEIKQINKNVYVTQCHLMETPPEACSGTLFIEGFVRKNIQYATVSCVSENGQTISGGINHTTVRIPFRGTATVEFLRRPVLRGPIFNTTPPADSVEFLGEFSNTKDICAEPVMGLNPCQKGFVHTENFNEPIFCELIGAVIKEDDFQKCPRPISSSCCDNNIERTFKTLEEKMLITITLKVLQKQQVGLTAIL
ncbi:CsxC family protein [Clostridium thailandense]|uniref:CsxC family protein n=1 Tax=Clostridium thailandense TaxID=2794346 RepID=UPI003989E22A